MSNPTFTSDGQEVAIMAIPGHGGKYASVFLSQDRKRVGIRLEQNRRFGVPFVVWMDVRCVHQLSVALQDIEGRLA